MPLDAWRDTKATLHRFCQVVGKLRLAASVRRNHWWNVPFHLTGRGITTRPMGQVDGNPIFTIDFDFVDHQLRIHTLDGRAAAVPLQGQSVASFHDQTLQALAALGITVAIAHPWGADIQTYACELRVSDTARLATVALPSPHRRGPRCCRSSPP